MSYYYLELLLRSFRELEEFFEFLGKQEGFLAFLSITYCSLEKRSRVYREIKSSFETYLFLSLLMRSALVIVFSTIKIIKYNIGRLLHRTKTKVGLGTKYNKFESNTLLIRPSDHMF